MKIRFKGDEMRVWARLNLLNYLELESNGYSLFSFNKKYY
jgi:hypothetical protein